MEKKKKALQESKIKKELNVKLKVRPLFLDSLSLIIVKVIEDQ